MLATDMAGLGKAIITLGKIFGPLYVSLVVYYCILWYTHTATTYNTSAGPGWASASIFAQKRQWREVLFNFIGTWFGAVSSLSLCILIC